MKDTVAVPEFYTVIGIRIDAYESIIEKEKHFQSEDRARKYASDLQQAGLIAIVAAI